MGTAIFFSTPAHGHINPTLPVITELSKRGERIIYYSSEEFQAAIEHTGALFRSYNYSFWCRKEPREKVTIKNLEALIQDCFALLPELLQATQEFNPDYIMHDSLCPWGKYIAQITGVPAICSSVIFGQTRHLLINHSPGLIGRLWRTARILKHEARIHALVCRLSETYGISKPDLVDLFTNVEPLTLVYTSQQFQPYAHLLDDRFTFVGPSIYPRSEAPTFPFEQLAKDKPLIYISLGTFFTADLRLYQMCCEAFAGFPAQVVLTLGKRISADQLGVIPDNVIVRQFVPQLSLLPYVDLCINNAGIGSVNEAMYYGVPLLTIPQAGDQFWVARRIVEVGAGKTLTRKSFSVQRLRQSTEELLTNPSYAQASARMGETLRLAGGYKQAADTILRFHRSRHIKETADQYVDRGG